MAIYVELIKIDVIEPDFVHYTYQFTVAGVFNTDQLVIRSDINQR